MGMVNPNPDHVSDRPLPDTNMQMATPKEPGSTEQHSERTHNCSDSLLWAKSVSVDRLLTLKYKDGLALGTENKMNIYQHKTQTAVICFRGMN